MNYGLVKVFAQVAGLGGLALAVFLVVFRDVIRKRVFARLSPEHSFRLLRLVLALVSLIALAGILAWVYAQKTGFAGEPRAGTLELVDATVDDERKEFPRLDIRLRNTGATAFLKRADFHIKKVWRFFSQFRPYSVPIAWSYDVRIPVGGAPYTMQVPISQAVNQQGVDRFAFVLGNDGPAGELGATGYIFLLSVDLIYNADNSVLSTPLLAFIAKPAARVEASSTSDPLPVYIQNKTAMNEVLSFQPKLGTGLSKTNKALNDVVPMVVETLEIATDEEELSSHIDSLKAIVPFDGRAREALKKLSARVDRPRLQTLAREALRSLGSLEPGKH